MGATHIPKFVIALVFFVGGVAAVEPDADKEGPRGNWRFVSTTEGGREQHVPEDMRLVMTDDRWTTTRPRQDAMGGKYTLDDSKRPRHIDMVVEGDPSRPIVQKGIYERDGDTLRIRIAAAGESRPADFNGNEAKAETTWVLKRVPETPKK